MGRSALLAMIFLAWAAVCVAVGATFARRGPAVALAALGSLLGAVVGFLVGNADGPAEVPASTAVGASIGLWATGLLALASTSAHGSARPLRRAGVLVLVVTPIAAAAFTLLLRFACPLYVMGRGSGFCNYQGTDVLGGWLSGVVFAFVVDALFVAGLFFASAWQARRPASQSRAGRESNPQPSDP